MFRCRNSLWWQSCECCNNFCLPSGRHCSLNTKSTVLTSCALIGTRCKLAAYIMWAAFESGLNTSWWMQNSLPEVLCTCTFPNLPRTRSGNGLGTRLAPEDYSNSVQQCQVHVKAQNSGLVAAILNS